MDEVRRSSGCWWPGHCLQVRRAPNVEAVSRSMRTGGLARGASGRVRKGFFQASGIGLYGTVASVDQDVGTDTEVITFGTVLCWYARCQCECTLSVL